MQWPLTFAVSVLLAGQAVSAGLLARDIVHGIRRDDATDRAMRRRAASIANENYVEKRSAVAGSTTLSAAEWDTQTAAACVSALSSVGNSSVNPSGMAVCYNLPTLDSTTGTFQADMRLYRVADATGNFAGLSAEGIQIGLSYSGASVQPVNSSQIAKRELFSLISWPSTKRGLDRRTNDPTITSTYAFVGQVNQEAMTSNMTDAEFQAAVLPTVTLTAVTNSGAAAFNTTLNSTQAAFLVGAFSGSKAVASGSTTAEAASSTSAAATAVATTATAAASGATTTSTVFIVPGTKILIFPIGAIITGIWTFLGTAVVMYGTFGRIQFRDQYRRQTARQNAGNIARI